MDERLSPNYKHEKLESPCYADLVDVFEDLWKHFVFSPVDMLLRHPHGDVAAMTILCSYFEAVWSYFTGEDSDKRSTEFFVKGFCQVFKSEDAGSEKAAHCIYKHIRCSLAHVGMLTHQVNYSRSGAKAFYLTFPKKPDGTLNMDAPVRSIFVNPVRMYEGVIRHFQGYVTKLREADDQTLVTSFQRTAHRLWGLGTEDNIIGMTQEEFLGRA